MKTFHLDPEKYHCKHSNKIVSEILPTGYEPLYIRLPIRFFGQACNCNETRFVSLVKMSFANPYGSLSSKQCSVVWGKGMLNHQSRTFKDHIPGILMHKRK